MIIKELFNLYYKNQEIVRSYSVSNNAESLIEQIRELVLIDDDSINIFSRKEFKGYFCDNKGRELELMSNFTFWSTYLIGNPTVIHLKINETDKDGSVLNVNYKNSKTHKKEHYTLLVILFAVLLILIIRFDILSDILSAVIFLSTLLFFYAFTLFIKLYNIRTMIKLFKSNFINRLE